MANTLERYQRCSYGARQDQKAQSSYQEYLNLKARVDILQQSHRHYIGEDLEQLGLKELDQLERQLDSSLRKVRSTKTQQMLGQLSELQQKEQSLLDINKSLRSKLEESSAAYHLSWEGCNFENRRLQAHRDGGIHHRDCNENMQTGYINKEGTNDAMDVPSTSQHGNGVIPGWML